MKLNLFFLSAAAMVNAAYGIDSVDLGPDAGDYVILAKTAISTVPKSVITGNIAVSPASSAAITGFSLIIDSSNTFSTSSQIADTYKVKASDYTDGPELNTAIIQMETAYDDAASRLTTRYITDPNLGGQTLESGVYTFDVDVSITGGDLTFSGSATDVFIIQTSKNVLQAAATDVILAGGAKAENIFWSVADTVTVNAGAHMEGIFLAKKGVTFITGSSLNGRIFSQTAVVLQMAVITQPPVSRS
jgi:hypothetical protein